MKRYFYSYQTVVRFAETIHSHHYRLRCVPGCYSFQKTVNGTLFIPGPFPASEGIDGLGNGIQYGSWRSPHKSFSFVSCGEVEQTLYSIGPDLPVGLFLPSGALCGVSEAMMELLSGIPDSLAPLDKALLISDRLYASMAYTPGTTGMDTTAEKAFEAGRGVCQDYAHILIALCRRAGIPARYVNGLIPDATVTHAWVEVWDGQRWKGVDPTHNRLVEYGYIKLAHGRDASDCPVSRGVFKGNPIQFTDISTKVEQL